MNEIEKLDLIKREGNEGLIGMDFEIDHHSSSTKKQESVRQDLLDLESQTDDARKVIEGTEMIALDFEVTKENWLNNLEHSLVSISNKEGSSQVTFDDFICFADLPKTYEIIFDSIPLDQYTIVLTADEAMLKIKETIERVEASNSFDELVKSSKNKPFPLVSIWGLSE